MKNSFLIYNDYKEFFDILTDDQLGKILRAMMAYSIDKTILELPLELKITFIQIKQQMDRNEVKYMELCLKNKENVSKRWNKIPTNTTVYDGVPKYTKHTDKDKDKDKINNIYIAYKEKINKESRLTTLASEKITQRLKTYSLEEILKAIKNFSADEWNMSNNSFRGIAWFFHTDDRIDGFMTLNLRGGRKEPEVTYLNDKKNEDSNPNL